MTELQADTYVQKIGRVAKNATFLHISFPPFPPSLPSLPSLPSFKARPAGDTEDKTHDRDGTRGTLIF